MLKPEKDIFQRSLNLFRSRNKLFHKRNTLFQSVKQFVSALTYHCEHIGFQAIIHAVKTISSFFHRKK